PSILTGILIIIFSVLLASLMSRFIETPFKKMEISIRPLKYIGLGVLLNIIFAGTLFILYSKSIPDVHTLVNDTEYPGSAAIHFDLDVPEKDYIPTPEIAMTDLAESYDDKMNQSKNSGSLKVGEYGVTDNNEYTVALVGSSHSAHWLGALQSFSEEENIKILNIIQVGSRFSSKNTANSTMTWNNNVMNYLEENQSNIDLVVATSDIGEADYPLPPEGMAEQLNKIA